MPVIYKSFQSVLANKEGKKLFYPRVVLTGNVDTEQVAKEIAELSSLSTGDSKNVIDNLVTVMTRHLQSSESVTLDGLGTFRLTMKSTMNGVEDPLKVSATQSTLRVRFLPTSKRNLDHTVSTRSLVTGVKCVRFDLRTRQVRAATTTARAVTTVTKVKIRWDKAIYDLTIYDVRLKFVLLNNRAYAGIYDTKSNRTS